MCFDFLLFVGEHCLEDWLDVRNKLMHLGNESKRGKKEHSVEDKTSQVNARVL